MQTGAGVGHGGKHPRPCGRHRRQDGRADRRLGRETAAGQAAYDHLSRCAHPLPRGGPHGLRTPYRRTEGALRRTRFPHLYGRSGQCGARGAAGRRSAPGGADPARGGGPRQVRGGEESRARGPGRPLRSPGGTGPGTGDRGGSGGRVGAFGAADRHGGDRAARLRAGGVGRAAARRGGRGGPLRGVLLRHRDHRIRRIQRPHRGAVAGRGALPICTPRSSRRCSPTSASPRSVRTSSST